MQRTGALDSTSCTDAVYDYVFYMFERRRAPDPDRRATDLGRERETAERQYTIAHTKQATSKTLSGCTAHYGTAPHASRMQHDSGSPGFGAPSPSSITVHTLSNLRMVHILFVYRS